MISYLKSYFNDFLRSNQRVGYCITVPDFSLVLQGLRCLKNIYIYIYIYIVDGNIKY